MTEKFTEKHRILNYECDMTGRLTLPMLLNIVITTSENQSNALGRGVEYIAQYGLTWVITEYQMDVKQMPQNHELVSVTTQATSYNKFFCYRSFWIHDEAGNECLRIDSTFVLMDMKNRKMSRVVPEIIAPYECEKINKITRSPELSKLEHPTELAYRVRFLDIDGNRHVNNSKYLEWMTDVLGAEFLLIHDLKSLHIKFEREVEYGKEVASLWEISSEDDTVVTKHEIQTEGTICTKAEIRWLKSN